VVLLYRTESAGVATAARRSPLSQSAYFADVTSSADNDIADDSVTGVNELTTSYGDCDCTSDTRIQSPASVSSSNSGSDNRRRTTSSTSDLYRAPTLLHSRQQRKKRSRAAFSHAQVGA